MYFLVIFWMVYWHMGRFWSSFVFWFVTWKKGLVFLVRCSFCSFLHLTLLKFGRMLAFWSWWNFWIRLLRRVLFDLFLKTIKSVLNNLLSWILGRSSFQYRAESNGGVMRSFSLNWCVWIYWNVWCDSKSRLIAVF